MLNFRKVEDGQEAESFESQLEVGSSSIEGEDLNDRGSSCWYCCDGNFCSVIWAIFNKRMTRILALGQILSCFIAGTSFCASSLADRGVMMPSFLNMLSYTLLAIVHTPFIIGQPLKLPCWRYWAYAVLDVSANVITLMSFMYTSMTSVMVLDCATIPVAMILSIVFLAAVYTKNHVFAVITCLAGLGMVIYSDSRSEAASDGGDVQYPHALKGVLLAVLGASIYGTGNVMLEAIVKRHDRTEFLAMLGIAGACYSVIIILIMEIENLKSANFTFIVYVLCIGYVSCSLCFMMGMSLFLTLADAALLNLSLLTSDFYGLLIGIFVHHLTIDGLYIAGVMLIVFGLVFYNLQPPVTVVVNTEEFGLHLNGQTLSSSNDKE